MDSFSDRTISTIDFHTAGEPFRIVPEPPVPLPGGTVAERRALAIGDTPADRLRRLLCFEPRGHADMYGGFLTPPDDDGAHLGVLFWHKDGFSTACGHGTMALGAWAVRSGLVTPVDGVADVVIDVPSGRVTARVRVDGAARVQDDETPASDTRASDHLPTRITSIDFINVPSWVHETGRTVSTSCGDVTVDVSFGGALYAQVDATALGLTIEPGRVDQLIAAGREVKRALEGTSAAEHPTDPRLSGIYGTIFFEDLPRAGGEAVHQRNVTVFADGQVDRSPCGSGSAARVATLWAAGRLKEGDELRHGSIVGSEFTARVVERVHADGHDAVVPEITGMAYATGTASFTVDPDDPLAPGFVLR